MWVYMKTFKELANANNIDCWNGFKLPVSCKVVGRFHRNDLGTGQCLINEARRRDLSEWPFFEVVLYVEGNFANVTRLRYDK